jgi:hypothetical protein
VVLLVENWLIFLRGGSQRRLTLRRKSDHNVLKIENFYLYDSLRPNLKYDEVISTFDVVFDEVIFDELSSPRFVKGKVYILNS